MPKIFSDNSLEDLIYSGIENFNLLNSFDLKTVHDQNIARINSFHLNCFLIFPTLFLEMNPQKEQVFVSPLPR